MAWFNFRHNKIRDQIQHYILNEPNKITFVRETNVRCSFTSADRSSFYEQQRYDREYEYDRYRIKFDTPYGRVEMFVNAPSIKMDGGFLFVYEFFQSTYPLNEVNDWMAGYYPNKEIINIIETYAKKRVALELLRG